MNFFKLKFACCSRKLRMQQRLLVKSKTKIQKELDL